MPFLPTPFSFWRIAAFVLVGLIGASGAFFAGAVAHKKCVYPFCRGFVNGDKATPSALERVSGDLGNALQKEWRTTETHLYDLRIDRVLLDVVGRYGAIDTLGMDLIVAGNDGRLLRMDPTGAQTTLPTSIPIVTDGFTEASKEMTDFAPDWFGVKDVLVTPGETAAAFNLFATYHHWNDAEECATLRVGHVELRQGADTPSGIDVARDWQTVYETTPCIPLREIPEAEQATSPFRAFNGHMYGGRVVPGPGTTVLASFGDPDIERYCADPDAPCSFGRIMEVDYVTGAARVFSKGHRNPQGLHVAEDGRVWSTEHAHRGGDELNWVRRGEDYGWPHVSYTTDYNSRVYQRTEEAGGVTGSHDGYTRPIYAWVPGGVGISQLTSVSSGSPFRKWTGDLLAGSLSGQSLYRVRIRDDRAVLVERIRLKVRVRDVAERPDGSIAVKTDAPYLLLLRPASPDPAPKEKEALAVREER